MHVITFLNYKPIVKGKIMVFILQFTQEFHDNGVVCVILTLHLHICI